MFSSLDRIDNPFLRSITAASTSFAMATLISAVAIGLSKPETKSLHKLGVVASLMATARGAIWGAIYKRKSAVSIDRASTATLDRQLILIIVELNPIVPVLVFQL
jgi:hypothetical protein